MEHPIVYITFSIIIPKSVSQLCSQFCSKLLMMCGEELFAFIFLLLLQYFFVPLYVFLVFSKFSLMQILRAVFLYLLLFLLFLWEGVLKFCMQPKVTTTRFVTLINISIFRKIRKDLIELIILTWPLASGQAKKTILPYMAVT